MTYRNPDQSVGEPSLQYVDTHCHLDDESFTGDVAEILTRARDIGVSRWINVGFNPDRWQGTIDLAEKFSGMSLMLGVHPGDAEIWTPEVHQALIARAVMQQPVAIGEIGLDFFRGETNLDQQVKAFEAQLDIAVETGIPAAVHMRDSERYMLEVLRDRKTRPMLLFHSYDGSDELTDWIIDQGAYVGVGGLATRRKSTELHRQLVRIPLDHIVLESDSPYLVPNGFKHRRNTPESIPHVAAFLARLLETGIEEIATRTTHNAEILFERLQLA